MSAERISDEPDRRHTWAEAAVEAEFETGRREETVDEAQASLLIRFLRITAGTLTSLLGLILIPLPGPGLIVLAGGLSILAVDVPFARKLRQKVGERMPQNESGRTPAWLVASMGAAAAFGLAFSALLFLST